MQILLLPIILSVSAIQIHAQYVHPFHGHIIEPKSIQTYSFDYILRTEPIPYIIDKSNPKISDRTLCFTDFNASTTEEIDALNNLINNFDFGITRTPPVSRSNSIGVLSDDFLPSPALQFNPPIQKNIIGHEPKVSFREINKFISCNDEIPQSDFIFASKDSALFDDSLLTSTFMPDLFASSLIQPEYPSNKQNKKAKDDSQNIEESKNYLNSYHVLNLTQSYPDYSPSVHIPQISDFNIFNNSIIVTESAEITEGEITTQTIFSENVISRNFRQRRLTTYVWEMTDFSDYVSNNTNDYFQLTGYSGDDLKIVIKPLSSGGVAAGTAENGSATQGVASNMPVYPDSGIWTPSTRTYNDFMKITGTLPNSITIDASAVKYYMNWHYGDWDISTTDVSTNHYDLVYYSAVPEPSTYFMTGAILGLLGFNRESRSAVKRMLQNVFLKFPLKKNCSSIQKKVF